MSVSVAYGLTATIEETLPTNTDSAADASRKVTHSSFNESGTLTAASSPPATVQASFVKAMSGGAATIDLTALTGTNGATVDGTGLRVQVIRVKNLGANVLNVAIGASNGWDGMGSAFSVDLAQNGVFEAFLNDAGSNISSTIKTIDLAGTTTQTSEWTIVMG